MRDHNDIKNLSKKRMYDGFFKMDKYSFQFRHYDGHWSPFTEREVFERGQAAAVLLYDPDLDRVVLVEQLRIAAINNKASPWLIEVVAGIIDPGYSAEQTVIKETKEETGLKIDELFKISEFYSSPGGSSEVLHLFCAKILSENVPENNQGIHGAVSEGENIRVLVMESCAAFEAVKTGKINNATTIIALQWLEINQEVLKKRWKS